MSDVIKVSLAMRGDGINRGIVVGFSRIAAARGWLLDLAPPSPDSLEALVRRIAEWDPHVLVIGHEAWPSLPRRVLAGRVLLGAEIDLTAAGIPSIIADNPAVGTMAAQHLLARGLRSFAAFGLDARAQFARDRAASFRHTVRDAGKTFVGWGRRGDAILPLRRSQWLDGIGPWLGRLPRPVGVLACCDNWGRHLIAECRRYDVRVPDDVAIVGVDNDQFACELSQPPLSSVMVPWGRIGQELALRAERMLAGQRADDEPLLRRIPPARVVERRSSDVMAVEDDEVSAALRYIGRHAHRGINVPDVLVQVPTYRRSLERRFRRLLGRTIMQEIRRVHLEQAKRLLVTTELTTAEIAERSGFANAKKLAEAFGKHLGMTATDYRRRFHLHG